MGMNHTHDLSMTEYHDLITQGQHHIQILAYKQNAHPVLLLLV